MRRVGLVSIGALAMLLVSRAIADPPPTAEPRILEGCEVFEEEAAGAAGHAKCASCKAGYQLSSVGDCLRLGDFGSTRDVIRRANPPRLKKRRQR